MNEASDRAALTRLPPFLDGTLDFTSVEVIRRANGGDFHSQRTVKDSPNAAAGRAISRAIKRDGRFELKEKRIRIRDDAGHPTTTAKWGLKATPSARNRLPEPD